MSQAITTTPSCYLIGSDTLLAQCGEILLERGFQIRGVITASDRIAAWAESKNIGAHATSSDYVAVLQKDEFDYLFAITHLALIPDAATTAPSKLAINFHDGPLPAYAGLNTPMWALINGESEYGVTWHIMSTGIDKGDILLQQEVSISDDDTALSLNTKCFAAAIESFPVLVDQLVDDRVQRTKQDSSKRTYFAKKRKPPMAAIADWQNSAASIERTMRALDTGAYPNTLASAKVLLADSAAFLLSSGRVESNDSSQEPSTLVAVRDAEIDVQTSDGVLTITGVASLDGQPAELNKIVAEHGLRAGDRLPVPNCEQITEIVDAISRHESKLLKQFEAVRAIDMPQRRATDSGGSDERKTLSVSIPGNFTALSSDHNPAQTLAAAFVLFLHRSLGAESVDIALNADIELPGLEKHQVVFANHAFVASQLEEDTPVTEALAQVGNDLKECSHKAVWLRDLVARTPSLQSNPMFSRELPLPIAIAFDALLASPEVDSAELVLRIQNDATAALDYSARAFDDMDAERIVSQLSNFLTSLCESPDETVAQLALIGQDELERLTKEWNATSVEYDRSETIHGAFERQVNATPDAIAVAFEDQEVSYAELNDRADRLAAHLVSLGVSADTMIGVHVERSVELLVATLGVMKSGAAYVPLDPAFPPDRLEYMIGDSAMPIIVTQPSLASSLPGTAAKILDIHEVDNNSDYDKEPLKSVSVQADNLAYVIYTSGSTGKPKGVMIEHRNVINFFIGMDAEIPREQQKQNVWLAVTSLSFDISVLELFWSLTRGFKVVVHDEVKTRAEQGTSQRISRQLDLGLFMWGNDDAAGPAKYRLLMEGSKYFDENGFYAVWTPERHFHAFGGPYPNPSVTGAAVAAVTKNIKIRSGSCVVPLHNPIRIAEEWAVVDNLSDGRVELSAASGWNPNDFVLRPESYKNNKQVMFDDLEKVCSLWRGEKISVPGPLGDVEVMSLPRPVQEELTCWITTAGNPETWKDAGRRGLNVLTHLLGQTVEEVGEKITIYRKARAEAGFDPDGGRVALMLHTFVGEDDDHVRELVREPMKSYLQSSMRLAMNFAWTFPAFKRPGGKDSKPEDIDIASLSDEEVDTILNFAFDRYFETSGLFGTVDTCHSMLQRCSAIGVDEIACLLDFGVSTDEIMTSLPRMKELRERIDASVAEVAEVADYSFAEMVRRHKVTHLQCTPSMARMYAGEAEARGALAQVNHLLLGGEALPQSLARDLGEIRFGTLTNMYGPTETTIWSTTHRLDESNGAIPIGRPIANTQLYVLDKRLRPVPQGMSGELYIGGDGVARGYLNRSELTAERFVSNPFSDENGARIYATGDLVSYRHDGIVDYIGRADFQVKVRGYRIELGEIESVLDSQSSVIESAVIVKADDAADQRLVAFVVAESAGTTFTSGLREALRAALPAYMIPNEFVEIDAMPRTPNGKLDRKALQTLEQKKPALRAKVDAAPTNDTEATVAEIWRNVLKLDQVGVNENFFDIGGHSLLVVQLHGELKQRLSTPVSLTDLYQYPTIKSLSDYIAAGSSGEALQKSASRGARRRALRRRSA